MSTSIKKIIATFIVIVVFVGMYVGTILPYTKARAFIGMLNVFQEVKTVEEFKTGATEALDIPSPAGQVEFVRFLSNQILNIIDNKDAPVTTEVAKTLVDFLEEKYEALIEKEEAYPSQTQQFLMLGQLYYILGVKYGDLSSLEKAEFYYKKCLDVSPTRPQCLISLYVLYHVTNLDTEANILKEQILSYWPTEKSVR